MALILLGLYMMDVLTKHVVVKMTVTFSYTHRHTHTDTTGNTKKSFLREYLRQLEKNGSYHGKHADVQALSDELVSSSSSSSSSKKQKRTKQKEHASFMSYTTNGVKNVTQ